MIFISDLNFRATLWGNTQFHISYHTQSVKICKHKIFSSCEKSKRKDGYREILHPAFVYANRRRFDTRIQGS